MKKTSKKILIIEDDTSLNAALSDYLTRAGFKVTTTFNGQEALEVIKVDQPDLIILDLLMPVMDGYTFLEKIRTDDVNKDINIIILTNFSMSEEKVAQTVIEHRPVFFLVKSATKLSNLLEYINKVLLD